MEHLLQSRWILQVGLALNYWLPELTMSHLGDVSREMVDLKKIHAGVGCLVFLASILQSAMTSK